MARPRKEGLDYFPMDTILDEKVQGFEALSKFCCKEELTIDSFTIEQAI